MVNISTFSLDIIRKDRVAQFSNDFKEADAFQQLCYDLLKWKIRKQGIELTFYRTSGRDGGVDLSGVDSGDNAVICECKKNNTPKDAKTAFNKLRKTLKENLAKPEAKETLYLPWFNPRLKEYIYCVSCNFKNKTQKDKFKKDVKEMIEKLGEFDGLSHLKDEGFKVTVYGWENDLKGILEENRYLYHQWIECDFVSGIEYLSKPAARSDFRYSDYLYSDRLPYVSRDAFKTNNPGTGRLIGETEILDRLLDESGENGCVIYGEGGIGKTRLMLELGFTAEKWGWTVFKITKKLEWLDHLHQFLAPGHKYLLIFDYIEENPLFGTNIFEHLNRVAGDAVIRVIGNCRNTHMERADLEDSDLFQCINLDLKKNPLERRYKDYVIENILGDANALLPYTTDFHQLRPAFAVFLRFHRDRSPKEEFREFKSFREWVKRRLALTFDKKKFDDLHEQQEVFHLFAILPSERDTTNLLYEKYHKAGYISTLKKDGWLEDDEHKRGSKEHKNELKVIHDTIADEMLIFRLEKEREVLKTEIKHIFDFAFENNSFESCFRAFERISDWQEFKDRKYVFYEIFSEVLREKPGSCGTCDQFVTTSLLEPDASIELMLENIDFFSKAIESLSFGRKISIKLKQCGKLKDPSLVKEKADRLFNTWYSANPDFMRDSYISARVIAAFMRFFGINSNFGTNGDPVKIHAGKWLEKCRYAEAASFVMQSWLDAGGEKEVIQKHLTAWLQKFPEEMETSFVIKSWLPGEIRDRQNNAFNILRHDCQNQPTTPRLHPQIQKLTAYRNQY